MAKPKLRFPEFMDEWKEYRISEVFDKVVNPVIVEKNKYYKQIGIRSHGKGLFYKEEVTGGELGNKRVFWIEPDCFVVNIVFAWERAVAKLTEAERGMIASHRFPMYKPKAQVLDLDYITEYFVTFYGHKILILASPGGAGRNKTLGQEEFAKSKIKLPSYVEQKKIAKFLFSVDDLIQVLEEEVSSLEEQKKGIMQKLFNREVRFKADNGSEFPEWEEKTLGEIGNFYGGLTGKSKEDFGIGEKKYITYINVYKNTFIQHDLLENVDIKDGERQHTVEYGDILFTQSSETVEEVGLTSVYLYDDKPYLNSFCMGLHLKDTSYLLPQYMGYLMRSPFIRRMIIREGQGISRINLAASRIIDVKLAIPCLKEQRRISDCLLAYDEAIQIKKDKLEVWKEIKKGLLQQMFV